MTKWQSEASAMTSNFWKNDYFSAGENPGERKATSTCPETRTTNVESLLLPATQLFSLGKDLLVDKWQTDSPVLHFCRIYVH